MVNDLSMEMGLSTVTYIGLQTPTLKLNMTFIHDDKNLISTDLALARRDLPTPLCVPQKSPTYVKVLQVKQIVSSILYSNKEHDPLSSEKIQNCYIIAYLHNCIFELFAYNQAFEHWYRVPSTNFKSYHSRRIVDSQTFAHRNQTRKP